MTPRSLSDQCKALDCLLIDSQPPKVRKQTLNCIAEHHYQTRNLSYVEFFKGPVKLFIIEPNDINITVNTNSCLEMTCNSACGELYRC